MKIETLMVKVAESNEITAEMGLKIFEAIEEKFPHTGCSIVTWYLLYNQLNNGEVSLAREEKIRVADLGYAVWISSSSLEIEPIGQAINNLLEKMKPSEIEWKDLKKEAEEVSVDW